MRKANKKESMVAVCIGTLFLNIAGLYSADAAVDPNILSVAELNSGIRKKITTEELRKTFRQVTYYTATPWTEKNDRVEYRGPYLKDVLSKSGFENFKTLRVTAYDNFNSRITREEVDTYNPILAVARKCLPVDVDEGSCRTVEDFRPLTMLDKGPIFIVWPLSKLPDSYVPTRNAIWVFFPVLLQAEP